MNIEEICEIYDIINYSINSDNSIDVEGDVDLSNMGHKELPLNFNKVYGDFHCGYNQLTSLEGSPKWVGEDFNCTDN